MARYRVRDKDKLRDRLAKSKRVVPHTVRSLAEQVSVSPSLVGHLLSGERETVDSNVAERISAELQVPLSELFVLSEYPSGYGGGEAEVGDA